MLHMFSLPPKYIGILFMNSLPCITLWSCCACFSLVLLPSHIFSLLLTCSRTCGACVFLKTLFHLLAAFERKGDGQVIAALAILHSPPSLFFLSTQAGPWLVWPVSFSSSFLLYLFSIFLQMYEKQVVSWSFMYNDMAFLIVLLQISASKICKGNINCMLINHGKHSDVPRSRAFR